MVSFSLINLKCKRRRLVFVNLPKSYVIILSPVKNIVQKMNLGNIRHCLLKTDFSTLMEDNFATFLTDLFEKLDPSPWNILSKKITKDAQSN